MNTDILAAIIIVALAVVCFAYHKSNTRLIRLNKEAFDWLRVAQGNTEKWRRLCEEYGRKHAAFSSGVEKLVFGDIRMRSSKDILSYLTDRLSHGVVPFQYEHPTLDTRPSSPSPGVPAKAQQPPANSQVPQTQA